MYQFAVAMLIVLGVFFFIDLTTNGLNDCNDKPQYCSTYSEMVEQYPQFVPPENLIHQYIDNALEHH